MACGREGALPMTATKPPRTRKPTNGRVEHAKIRDTGIYLVDSGDDRNWINRILIGTPTRGNVTIEWHAQLQMLTVPANWSNGWAAYRLPHSYPKRYTVAHGQNIIVNTFMNGRPEHEWLLLLEDDVIPPTDLFIQLDKYLRNGPPIVSGLYYQKGLPPEPLVYRGRGNGAYTNWKLGQKVWCDGVPTGCLLIHGSIIRLLWEESPTYSVTARQPDGTETSVTLREVFKTPYHQITGENGQTVQHVSGTSDLEFCRRVVHDNVLKRAGWPEIARKKWPFLVDTNIFCRHVTPDGTMYP